MRRGKFRRISLVWDKRNDNSQTLYLLWGTTATPVLDFFAHISLTAAAACQSHSHVDRSTLPPMVRTPVLYSRSAKIVNQNYEKSRSQRDTVTSRRWTLWNYKYTHLMLVFPAPGPRYRARRPCQSIWSRRNMALCQ